MSKGSLLTFTFYQPLNSLKGKRFYKILRSIKFRCSQSTSKDQKKPSPQTFLLVRLSRDPGPLPLGGDNSRTHVDVMLTFEGERESRCQCIHGSVLLSHQSHLWRQAFFQKIFIIDLFYFVGIWSSGTRITGALKLPGCCWDQNPGPPQGLSELSSQTSRTNFLYTGKYKLF